MGETQSDENFHRISSWESPEISIWELIKLLLDGATATPEKLAFHPSRSVPYRLRNTSKGIGKGDWQQAPSCEIYRALAHPIARPVKVSRNAIGCAKENYFLWHSAWHLLWTVVQNTRSTSHNRARSSVTRK